MQENYYKTLIDMLPIGYAKCKITIDEQETLTDIAFVETNSAFLKISGIISDDLSGRSISEYIPKIPELAQKYGKHILKASKSTNPVSFDYFSLTKKRWLRVTAFCPESGYLAIMITDITREKNDASPELESEILQGFLHAMKDGAFVKNAEFKYIMTNKALESIFHSTAEEIWGREDDVFLPELAAAACRKSDSISINEQKLVVTEEIVGDEIFQTTKFPVCLPGGEYGIGGIIRDITESVRQKEALELAQKQVLEEKNNSIAQMGAMFNGHGAVMLIMEPESGQILDANPAATDFYGYSRDELLGMMINDINQLPPEKTKKYRMQAMQKQQNCITFPHRLKNGEVRMVDVYSSPIVYNDKKLLYAIIFDVTDREKAQEEIKFMSFHDYLTGVYNRRYFEEQFQRLNVPRNYPMAVVMGDVNGLKLINDSFGHAKGDQVLIQAGQGIQSSLRTDDIVARLGGDEFGILLPSTDEEEVADLLKRIQTTLAALSQETESSTMALLSLSFGYSVQKSPEESLDTLMKEAESFMNSRKHYDSRSLKSKTISIAMNTLFEKSPREKMHSERVGNTAAAIGEWMNLSEEKIDLIRIAGYMHDIGKIGIPETVLNKKGKLSDQEWETMKLHPEKSWRILENTAEYKVISNIVLCHHEKWDGTGYPRGLTGEKIPIEARIITLADSFDAMTHQRAYQDALDREEAVTELKRCAGSHFDPEITTLFVDRIDQIQG